MAWRIDELLIRGEVDNRVRGRVCGRLWFVGREEPVLLELEGNAWRDVAGHVLRFSNPAPRAGKPGELDGFAAVQRGVVGDITASRKVKVPECTMDELMEFYEAKKPFPWHWGNSLYLEWHSESNGRVVIESASYQLEIDPEQTWTMTEADEAEQRSVNGEAMVNFIKRVAEAIDAAEAEERAGEAAVDFEGDDDAPTTEAEAQADAEQARMDLLLDRVTARMKREQLRPEDWGRVYDEERARLRRERGEPDPEPMTPEQEAAQAEWVDEMNAAAEEALAEMEAGKWRAADGGGGDARERSVHPLVEQGNVLSDLIRQAFQVQGWVGADDPSEHPLRELDDGVMMATAKLAGAFGSGRGESDWPPEVLFAGGVLVRLKKARGHLRDALAGLDAADEQGLAEAGWRAGVRLQIEAMLGQVETMIREVRGVLEGEAGEGGVKGGEGLG